MSNELKVKGIDKTNRFLRFSCNKSMCFIHQKHAFLSINSMLLSDKSIALIFQNHNKNRKALIVNMLQNRSFSHNFQQKSFSLKILQA